MQSAWILPRANHNVLFARHPPAQAADPPVREGAALPVPLQAPYALDAEQPTAVFGEFGALGILRRLDLPAPTATLLRLPAGVRVRALATVGGVVFAGGDAGPDMLGSVHLDGEPQWHRLDVAPDVRWQVKSVAALVAHGNRLLVVDAAANPRVVPVYDVADPHAPRFVQTLTLPSHGGPEDVRAVAHGSGVLVVLSTTRQHGFITNHVSIMDLGSLAEVALLSVADRKGFGRAGQSQVSFHGVAVAHNTVVIAAGAEGLGVLRLDALRPAQDGRVALALEDIRFVQVHGGRVVDAVVVDDSHALAVVELGRGMFHRKWLDTVHVPLALPEPVMGVLL